MLWILLRGLRLLDASSPMPHHFWPSPLDDPMYPRLKL